MNVSEIKQEILDLLILNGRKPQTIKSGERVVYLYDALNIVNKEFSKTEQPQLNENQQIVLDWLKDEKENSNLTLFDCIYSFIYGNPEDLVTQIWTELNEKEEAQVLEAFGKWVQEQEEE